MQERELEYSAGPEQVEASGGRRGLLLIERIGYLILRLGQNVVSVAGQTVAIADLVTVLGKK